MNKVQVRCWELYAGTVKVFITYPEDNDGHCLGICVACGTVYAVDVTSEVYIGPPLADKLKGLPCDRCGRDLSHTWAAYPETYLDSSGAAGAFRRPRQIPDSAQSFVRSFPSIY